MTDNGAHTRLALKSLFVLSLARPVFSHLPLENAHYSLIQVSSTLDVTLDLLAIWDEPSWWAAHAGHHGVGRGP